jgi:hypothetical protein
VSERFVYEWHCGKDTEFRSELTDFNRRQVIGHDYRVQTQSRAECQSICQRNCNTAWMSSALHIAADHRDNDLLNTCIEIIGLDDKDWTQFDSGQIGVWKVD